MALACAALALLGLLAHPSPAAAQTVTTFISNTGQTSNNSTSLVRATAFTTGTGTYTLSSVGIFLPNYIFIGTPAVKIYGNTGGNPGTLLATMTNPGTFENAVNSFTAPANTTLSASTTYWVVTSNSAATDGTGFQVAVNLNTTLDSGAAAGWSIGNARSKSDIAHTSWTTSSFRLRFEIRGTSAATNNPPTVANTIPDQTATVGTAFSYVFPANTFSDADTSDTLTYTATKADDTALPLWLAFAAGTRTFSGTPTDAGMVALKVTASDGNGGSVSDEFDITVSAAADTTPPTLTSATVLEGGVFIQLQFSENMLQSNLVSTTTFTVTAAGSAVTVYNVEPAVSLLNAFWIRVRPTIRQGQAVVVTYTDPTAGNDHSAMQDTAGNDVDTFTTGMDGVPAVTNNSTVTNTPATGAPTITGTAQVGQTLTAGTTAIMDADGLTSVSYTYQWIRVATDNTETNISGATASTYTLVAADQGKTIKVKVSFTDDASNAETLTSAATVAVTAAPDTTPPTLTSVEVLESGGIIDFQFSENVQRLSESLPPASAFTVTADGSDLTTRFTSALLGVAYGIRITISPTIFQGQAVVATYTDPTAGDDANAIQDTAGNDAATFTTGMDGVPAVTNNSAVTNTPATGAPAITGTAQVGQTLTAGTTAIMDDDGLTSVSYTYQWIRVATDNTETNISGATASTHTLVAADLGTTIKVTVSFTDDASNPETLTSAATTAVSPAPNPNAHCNALDTSELWCGTLTVGVRTVVVFGYNRSLFLGSVAPLTFTHGGATITVNLLVYLGTRLSFGMSSALGAGDFSLEIGTGGAKRSFAMNNPGTQADFLNHGLSWSANETVPVKLLLVNTPATGAPAITGTAQVGQTLTATVGDIVDVDGLPDPFLTDANTSFQWIRVATDNSETDIGAMAGAYMLVADDQGTTIKVKVSFTGNNGFAETRTSAATAAVAAAADTTPPTLTSADVEITDALIINLVFSEDLQLSNRPAVSAFTVTVDGSAATVSSVLVPGSILPQNKLWLQLSTAILQGQAVVVTYTDPTAGNDHSAIQDIAGNDAADFTTGMNGVPAVTNNSLTTNTPATGAPTITGTAQVGETLTAATTTIMDANGLNNVSYTYQWIRVDGGTETNISGATASTHTLVAADQGTTIKVKVSFTDDDSNAETLTSAATVAVMAAANNPPTVATVIPDQTATVGTAFSYVFPANTFSDADTSDTLTYTATKADDTDLPLWLAFAAGTRTFSGTPTDAGMVALKVTASDGNGGSVSDTFDITVAADTTPPTLTSATVFETGVFIQLQFSENMLQSNLPPNTTFTVTAAGSAVTVYTLQPAVALLNAFWIRVGPTIHQGQAVVVTYTDPTAGNDSFAFQDIAGNDVATFTTGLNSVPAVTNNSTFTNTPATGAPTITGTAQVGQTLTAVTTTIMDDDGLTGVSYTYQWIRVATDNTETNIASATASTHTLVAADQGTTIKVKVSFTDDDSNAETLTSAATAAVAADTSPPTLISATVVPNGSIMRFQFSETLDVSNLPPVSAFTVTAGGNTITNSSTSQVPGSSDGVALSFSPPHIRQGQTVVLTYTDPTGGNDANAIQDTAGNDVETFTTDLNSVPAVINNSTLAPVAPGAPTGLTATASGSTQIDLSWTAPADNGGRVITGYKIEISPNGTDTWTTHLADTTSPNTTYAHTGLAASTTRHYRVSAINTIGTSAASNVDDATTGAGTNTPATGAPTITGTAQVGQTLTAGTTAIMDADGLTSVSYTYQWIRVDGGTETNISGATASTHTLVAADQGTTIKVKVSFTDDASNAETRTSAATAVVSAAPNPNAHCNALDTSELWCGTLTVGVSSVAYGYNATLSFGSVAPLTFTHGGATITVNRLLYAGIRFQFSMSSALGAGDFSLEIGTGGAKRSFAMNNPGTETDFFDHGLIWSANETVPVKLLLVNTPATGAPAITGTAQVGQTLTATVGDIADVDGLPDPFLTDANTSFQWIRVATDNSETDIGAMAGAYTLVADDQGTTIKVKVSFTGNNGFAETRTSAATAAVAAAPDTTPPTLTSADIEEDGGAIFLEFSEDLQLSNRPPASAFTLTVDGSAVTGFSVLVPGSFPPPITIWLQLSTAIIRQGQVVVVTYTDPTAGDDTLAIQDIAGNDAADFTTGMNGVPAVNNDSTVTNTPATGAPTITGTAQVGQMLTAGTTAIMDANGLTNVSYTYQWIRVATDNTETNIASATASTHTLVAADLGTTVKVRVSFTDDASNAETLTSAATAPVAAAGSTNTPATGAPTITGTATVGQTLTAGTTAIMDADGLDDVSYTYQWIRVATDNTETNISGATVSTHTLVAADLGTTIKVTVSFTDDASNPETLTSAATAAVTPAPNTLPLASDGTVTTNEDSAHTFTASEFNFSDADGDTLSNVKIVTLPASGTGTLALSGTPVTANQVVAATNIGTLAYTPPENANGTGYASFTFKVSDGTAESAADYTMTITVTAVNDAPTVATAMTDQPATVGTAFSYAFPANTFSDADTADTLTYTATKADDTALPAWLSFDAATRTFSGTPQAADVATVSIKVTVSDGNSGSISDSFDIVVSAAVPKPAHCNTMDTNELWCTTLTVGTDGVGNSYGYFDSNGSLTHTQFTYQGVDYNVLELFVDGMNLSLSFNPRGRAVFDNDAQYRLVAGTTEFSFGAVAYAGNDYTWPDQGLSWSTGDTVAVKLLRTPTVVNRIPNQTATTNNAFSYTFPENTFSGVGDTPVYTATKADGSALTSTWSSFDAGTRTFSGTPTSADIGTLSIRVTATNSTNQSLSDTFSIVVEANIAGETGRVAEAFSYTVAANIFADASTTGTLTYTARLTNGRALASNTQLSHGRVKPGWLRFNGSTRTFSGTPLPGSDGTLSVRVTASDETGARFSATFDLSVGVDSGLVGNFTRPGTTGRHLVWFDHAQKFTTGADTAGYTVTSIDVLLRDVHSNSNFPTVTIASGAAPPGSDVATLQTPTSGASGGDKPYRYTAPANLALSANTSYWIVITGGSSSIVRMTGWTIIDAGSSAGWSIESKTYRNNIRNNPGYSQGPNSSATSLRINGMTTGNQQAVDPPTVTRTPAISSAGEDGRWGPGETVEVTLTFSEAVEVEPSGGTPDIGIGLELTEARRAAYASGSGTDTLVFAYTLDNDDGNRSSMGVAPNSLTLNGGSIRSVATGVEAVLDHNGTAVQGSAGGTRRGPTASFSGLPGNHGGNPFTFALGFSAEPEGLSYRTVRGGLLNVEGGTVTKAVRSTRGSNQGWRVTVAPSGSDDVRIELPNRACGEANALCISGQPLAAAVSATIAHHEEAVALPPLTGSFSGAPTEHNGGEAFELKFRLSEEPRGISFRTVQNGLFTVSGGSITRAWRITAGENREWGLKVTPSGFGAVKLVVNATTDCGQAPGVCTDEGRMLAGGLAATIEGPPTLSVADAEVEEASDAALAFTVTLSRELSETVTVEYRTEDGTASAGADYTTTTGTLTFTPDQTTTTVSVPVLDDSHDEGSETLNLTLRNPTPARVKLADAEATGTITNSDPLPQAWLARFGRTVGTHVMDAVGERWRGAPGPGSEVIVGGYRVPLDRRTDGTGQAPAAAAGDAAEGEVAGERALATKLWGPLSTGTTAADPAEPQGRLAALVTGVAGVLGLGGSSPGGAGDAPVPASGLGWDPWVEGPGTDPSLGHSPTLTLDLRRLLLGSSFRLALGAADADASLPRLTAWGRFAGTTFDGKDGNLTLQGDVFTGTVGVDGTWDRWLAGVAVAHSRGDGGYTMAGMEDRGHGDLENTLTSIHPYLRYAVTDRLNVWGLVGYGWGDLELATAPGETLETDTNFMMGAFGGRGIVLAAAETGGFQLATRTDAMLTRTTSEAVAGLASSEAEAHRLRLVLEGSRGFTWPEGRSLTPTLEVGLRHDWGDAETGFGLELGGRVQYVDPRLGLTIEGAVRGLLAHEDSDYEEWGASGTVRLAPGANGQGLSLTLAPTWGAASSGVDGLWSRQTTAGLAPQGTRAAPAGQVNAEVGYGVAAPFGTGLLTPYVGTVLTDGAARTYRVGTRLELTGGWTTGVTLSLEGQRQEPVGPQPINQGLQFQAAWGF